MHFLQPLNLLLISQAAAAAFAAARLLHFGMHRRFLFLCSYLLIVAFSCTVFSVLSHKSKAYFWLYLIANPAIWCAAVLSILEMFTLIFRDYPGLRTAGRWSLNVALALSLSVSFLSLRMPWPNESSNTQWLFYELSLDRSIHFGLAVVTVILLTFLSRYPLHLDRNTYVSSGFFSAMFLVQSLGRLVDSRSQDLFVHYADYSEVAFSALCFVGWGIMLRPVNAAAPERPVPNKPKETELLQQLETLNNILSRAGRR